MQASAARGIACPFCADAKPPAETVEAMERMFGLGGNFTYCVCAACASIYLQDIGIDLSPYYPQNYYSYGTNQRSGLLTALDRWLAKRRARAIIRFCSAARARIDRNARIMDVGSGKADLLDGFRLLGFSKVVGVDPFLQPEIETNGLPVERRTIEELADDAGYRSSVDLLMFHHSLEHVSDPASSLRAASKLLSPCGAIVVRIPIVNYAWERYRTCWIGLDAPRHMAIPTESGFRTLAERLGFEVDHVAYDSDASQFVVSEAYERGRTLTEAFPSSPPRTVLRKILTLGASWRARHLNALGRGDQAAFLLRVSPSEMQEGQRSTQRSYMQSPA